MKTEKIVCFNELCKKKKRKIHAYVSFLLISCQVLQCNFGVGYFCLFYWLLFFQLVKIVVWSLEIILSSSEFQYAKL